MKKSEKKKSIRNKMANLGKLSALQKKIKKTQSAHKNEILEINENDKIKAALLQIANGEPTEFICDDYFVGSSNLYSVFTKFFDVKKAHSIYMTTARKKEIGRSGEYGFLCPRIDTKNCSLKTFNRLSKIKRYTPFGKHNQIKFLVASPDFIYMNENLCIGEIKTSIFQDQAIKNFENPSNRDLLQVWISMDVYFIHNAILEYYFFDKKTQEIRQVGSIYITKEEEFFDHESFELFLSNYVIFLRQHFAFLGFALTNQDIEYFKELVRTNFEINKRTKNQNSAYIKSCKIRGIQKYACKHLYAFVVGWDGAYENLEQYPYWKTTVNNINGNENVILWNQLENNNKECSDNKLINLCQEFNGHKVTNSSKSKKLIFNSKIR